MDSTIEYSIENSEPELRRASKMAGVQYVQSLEMGLFTYGGKV